MPQELITVRCIVDLLDTEQRGSLVFSRWLPLGKAEGLTFHHKNLSSVLWLEPDSVPFGVDQDDIPRTINIWVNKLYVEICASVDAELATWIRHRDCSHPPADDAVLADAYRQLGVDVNDAVDHGLSRFLSFVRVEKGQSWLPSRASHTELKARAPEGDWFRWCPTNVIHLTATMLTEDNPRLLRAADWESLQAFMARQTKPTLTLQLLAGAEAFRNSGSHRAALTEAVSALEVALSQFARSAVLANESIPETLRNRIGVDGLEQLVGRLGLTASVALLLPFLFSEAQLPADVLSSCREAIKQRQNVVHQGQRTLPPAKINEFLRALRQLCELLLRHSGAEGEK
jgi:hypothetical protein